MARKNLEGLILKERREAEKKIKEAETQMDNLTMNFQMVVAEKTAAETKSTTLGEQKKLLVKEVKQLRKKLEDSNSSVEELKAMNDRLVKAAQVLQARLKTATQCIHTEPEPFDGEKESGQVENSNGETDETVRDEMEPEDIDNLLRRSGEYAATLLVPPTEESHEETSIDHTTEEDTHHEEVEKRKRLSTSNNEDEERMSWDMPQTQLRELGWLTDEQSKLMEKRVSGEKNSAHPGSRSGSPTPFAGACKQSDDVLKEFNTSSSGIHKKNPSLSLFSSVLGTSVQDETPNHGIPEPQNRRSSLSMISSMFGSKLVSSSRKDDYSSTEHDEANTGKSAVSSPLEEDSNDERLPSAMRLLCLRCKGSVEGPKFSTCKCAIPALTPDDLHAHNSSGTLNMLSGMLSKSTSVAGGLAGGLMKATVVTASSVTGLVSYSSHTPNQDERSVSEDILL